MHIDKVNIIVISSIFKFKEEKKKTILEFVTIVYVSLKILFLFLLFFELWSILSEVWLTLIIFINLFISKLILNLRN